MKIAIEHSMPAMSEVCYAISLTNPQLETPCNTIKLPPHLQRNF